jgi:predicted metal-dependent hydrolase
MEPGCNKYTSWRTFNGARADLIFVISRDGTGEIVTTQSYPVRYSPRRRYPAVIVYPDLRVEVVAPPGTPLTAIEDLCRRKSAWVDRTLERFRAEPCQVMERAYVPGERFLFAGRERVLEFDEGDGYAARFDGDLLRVPVPAGVPAAEVRERVIELYREAAVEAIGSLIEVHAARMGVAPPPFRVKHLRRRWGSCSRAGRLNFNLRLAMAPPAELEYIVVHELCHLVRLDHSPAFWRTVERYLPDYDARRAALSAGSWQYVL